MAKSSKIITTDVLQYFWDGFKEKLHIHDNKSILDNTTASYTTDEKYKLDNIENGATKNIVDAELSQTSINPVQNKALYEALKNKLSTDGNAVSATKLQSPVNINNTQFDGSTDIIVPNISFGAEPFSKVTGTVWIEN